MSSFGVSMSDVNEIFGRGVNQGTLRRRPGAHGGRLAARRHMGLKINTSYNLQNLEDSVLFFVHLRTKLQTDPFFFAKVNAGTVQNEPTRPCQNLAKNEGLAAQLASRQLRVRAAELQGRRERG